MRRFWLAPRQEAARRMAKDAGGRPGYSYSLTADEYASAWVKQALSG